MSRHLRATALLTLTLASVSAAVAAGRFGAQAGAAQAADPAAAILASHKAADDAYRNAPMSPFTAIGVQYLQPGQPLRLGVGQDSASFGANPAGSDVVELTMQDGAFFVAPVAGAVPLVATTSGDGDVSGLPGTPVTAKTKLERRDIVHLGRFFIELLPGPLTGNARVFDPEAAARKAFTGLKWYPPNLALRVSARFVPNPAAKGAASNSVTIATTRGLQKVYFRVGTFEFTVDGKALRLTVLAAAAAPETGEELFVAFRDATTGTETYDVGRYLFVPFAGADAAYVLDFNAATNPLCNYSAHYNCPIPPRENTLPVAIRAGEMKYPTHHQP